MATKNNIRITTHKDTAEYFKELVDRAIDRQDVETDETVAFYIVNLLSEYVKTDIPFPEGTTDEPLIMLLNNAMNSEYNEKIKRFKHLGDFSLFISGFFSDSLRRKLIDIDYYVVIGCIAYNNLSSMMKGYSNGELFYNLFSELAEKFKEFIDVIAEVSDITSISTNSDILRIYERWLKTGSSRDARLLKEKGVIPVSSKESRYLQ
ncbi:MAG: hypothetical protein HY578_03840 [Nitrospinae bacterium]|nr:hypothetical protein [Nitrospinota bacterium]